MISILSYGKETVHTDITIADIKTILPKKDVLLWVNIVEEPDEISKSILEDVFNFHPLAVDDALEERHSPKVDDWDAYLYLVIHAIGYDAHELTPLSTRELDIFLGTNFLVTYQVKAIDTVQRIWQTCLRDVHRLQQGTGRMLYYLIDELVGDYFPAIESIDDAIDAIEDEVFIKPRQSLLEDIFTLKRSTLHLRRIIAPQREVLSKLARGDFQVIRKEDRIFFRDVYDHLVRLYDIVDGLRDLAGSALETYLSVVNNRMNDIMKTLTIITTFFMPLSFLTGFFGMNFFFNPGGGIINTVFLTIVLLIMTVTPILMYFWMRRRAWM